MTEYKASMGAIAAAVKALGDTPGEIARKLEDRGIKGTMNNPESCALSNYITSTFPEVTAVLTGAGSISLTMDKEGTNRDWESFPTTEALNLFIRDFDRKEYGELVDEDDPGQLSHDEEDWDWIEDEWEEFDD